MRRVQLVEIGWSPAPGARRHTKLWHPRKKSRRCSYLRSSPSRSRRRGSSSGSSVSSPDSLAEVGRVEVDVASHLDPRVSIRVHRLERSQTWPIEVWMA